MSQTLKMYASGDGALHFCWIDDATQNGTGKKITREDAEKIVAESCRKGTHRVVVLNTLLAAVANIKRIDAETLEIVDDEGTRQYKYKIIDPENIWWKRDKHVQQTNLELRASNEVVGEFVVKNQSIIAATAHFLSNEKVLTAQPF